MLHFTSIILIAFCSAIFFQNVFAYSKVSKNGQTASQIPGSEGRSSSKIAFTVSPIYVPELKPKLKPGEAVDHTSTPKYSTLHHAIGSNLGVLNNGNRAQERFHPPPINFMKNGIRNQMSNSGSTSNQNDTSSPDIVYAKPMGPTYVYDPNTFKYTPDSKPTSTKPSQYIIDAYPPVPSNLPDSYSGPSEDDSSISYYHHNEEGSNPSYDDHLHKPLEYGSHYDHPPKLTDYDHHYEQPPKPVDYNHPPKPLDFDQPPKSMDYDHSAPKPVNYNSHYHDDHPYVDDSYVPEHYHHPIIYDHIPEIYHHHPKPTTSTTTTTEEPNNDDQRLSKKPYSYYHIGRKLWYVPLYFSIYFIIYVGALILKSIARHKVQYPGTMSDDDARRLEEEVSWSHIASTILTGIEKYGGILDDRSKRPSRSEKLQYMK